MFVTILWEKNQLKKKKKCRLFDLVTILLCLYGHVKGSDFINSIQFDQTLGSQAGHMLQYFTLFELYSF